MPKLSTPDAGRSALPDSRLTGYRWRELDIAHCDAVNRLHRAALADVPDKNLVRPEKPAFFAAILSGEGRTIGAFCEHTLIAYGVLQYQLEPGDDPRPELDLGTATPIAKLAGASVTQSHRGRGLQAELIRRRVALAESLGYSHQFSTSAPGNWPSWCNLVSQGFQIVALKMKYGGLLRFLLHHGPSAPLEPTVELCRSDDTEHLRALLSAGWRGFAAQRLADGHRAVLLSPGPSGNTASPDLS